MTALEHMDQCQRTESIAAFIDGRLDSRERRELIEHLDRCDDCRSTFELASAIVDVEDAGKVTRGGFGPRRWFAAAAAVAAAAAIVFLTPVRDYVMPSPIKGVQSAAERMRERPTALRLAEPFAYRPPKPVLRGGGNDLEDNTIAMEAEAARLQQQRASARNLHALGLTQLYLQHPDAAVAALEEAHSRDSDDVEIQLDYAAARAALGQQISSEEELAAALKIIDDVLARDANNATALFNRGFVLEDLRRHAEAVQAYRRYLATDAKSEWAKEVQRRLATLEHR